MSTTNSVSECSFSAMRRIKSYLRSTMAQEQLNNLMILHVHKEITDALDLVQVANEFVRSNESRLHSFGKFSFCLYLYIQLCTFIMFRLTAPHHWQHIIIP